MKTASSKSWRGEGGEVDEMRRKLFNNFEFFWWGRSMMSSLRWSSLLNLWILMTVIALPAASTQSADWSSLNYCYSLCFYYEKIFGIFESFVLCSSTIAHTLTGRAHRDRSIFSTPNGGIGERQWDGKKIISILFYFLLCDPLSLSCSLTRRFTPSYGDGESLPRCFISFYDFI